MWWKGITFEFPLYWREHHYREAHPKYVGWSRRWFRNFFAFVTIFLVVIGISNYLWFQYGGSYGNIAGIVNVLFVAFALYYWSSVRRKGVRRFILEWEEGINPTSHLLRKN